MANKTLAPAMTHVTGKCLCFNQLLSDFSRGEILDVHFIFQGRGWRWSTPSREGRTWVMRSVYKEGLGLEYLLAAKRKTESIMLGVQRACDKCVGRGNSQAGTQPFKDFSLHSSAICFPFLSYPLLPPFYNTRKPSKDQENSRPTAWKACIIWQLP